MTLPPQLGAPLRGAAALLRTVRGRQELPEALQQAWRMLAEGGVLVRTPEDAPLVSTTIQLDGDQVIIVNTDAFTRTPEALQALASAHGARVRAAVELLRRIRQAGDALRALRWTALTAHLAGQAYLILDAALRAFHGGWETVEAVRFAAPLLAFAAYRGLCRAAAWAARRYVRARLDPLLHVQREQSHKWLPRAGQ